MGWKEQQDHNEGQKAGAEADFFDALVEAMNPFTSPEYKQGFWHAQEQKYSSESQKDC